MVELERLGTYWAVLVGVYIFSKIFYNMIGIKDVYKTTIQEQLSFQSILIYGLLLFIATSLYNNVDIFGNTSYIINWRIYFGLIMGLIFPMTQYLTSEMPFVQWLIYIIIIIGYIYNLTFVNDKVTSIIYSLAILFVFYLSLVSLPRSKRAETVEITKSGNLQQGATIAILGPQLNPSSPLFYLILSLLMSPLSSDIGILISYIFVGAFIGSTAIYGSGWLFTDKTIIKPEQCLGLSEKQLIDISTNQDISTLRWLVGLLVIIQIFTIIYNFY